MKKTVSIFAVIILLVLLIKAYFLFQEATSKIALAKGQSKYESKEIPSDYLSLLISGVRPDLKDITTKQIGLRNPITKCSIDSVDLIFYKIAVKNKNGIGELIDINDDFRSTLREVYANVYTQKMTFNFQTNYPGPAIKLYFGFKNDVDTLLINQNAFVLYTENDFSLSYSAKSRADIFIKIKNRGFNTRKTPLCIAMILRENFLYLVVGQSSKNFDRDNSRDLFSHLIHFKQ